MTVTVNAGQFRMDFRPAGVPDTRDFSEKYRDAQQVGWPGACPIEAGYLGNLIDHECSHGALPGDRIVGCRCWG